MARFMQRVAVAGALVALSAGMAFADSAAPFRVKFANTSLQQGSTVALPDQPVGVWTDPNSFEIINTGSSVITFGGSNPVTITGNAAGMFRVVQQPSATLAPGQRTYFQIKYWPTEEGLNDATISIAMADSSQSGFSFHLQSPASHHPGGGQLIVP